MRSFFPGCSTGLCLGQPPRRRTGATAHPSLKSAFSASEAFACATMESFARHIASTLHGGLHPPKSDLGGRPSGYITIKVGAPKPYLLQLLEPDPFIASEVSIRTLGAISVIDVDFQRLQDTTIYSDFCGLSEPMRPAALYQTYQSQYHSCSYTIIQYRNCL